MKKGKLHYWFNPITEKILVSEDGKICGGCIGDVAWTVACIQTLNDPESITFDTCLDIKNAESRIVNIN